MSEIRRIKGYSQSVIAKKLGVRQKTVSEWENGLYMPTSENLKKLSEVLEVSEDELKAYFQRKVEENSSFRKKSNKKNRLKEIVSDLYSEGFSKKEILSIVKEAFE